jgi:hypothetical protein
MECHFKYTLIFIISEQPWAAYIRVILQYGGFSRILRVTMRSMAFWDVKPCSLETAQNFGGTYHSHLQGKIVTQARNQQKQAESSTVSFILKVLISSSEIADST